MRPIPAAETLGDFPRRHRGREGPARLEVLWTAPLVPARQDCPELELRHDPAARRIARGARLARAAALGLALFAAACDEKTPGVSAYAAYQGRWTGTVAGEDWEIAVSTAYGRDLVRVQTPRGMAWHALPPRGTGGGKYPIESRYGGAVTLDMTVDGRMLVHGDWWGGPGWTPVTADYDGDGADDLAVYEAASGRWRIRRLNGTVLAWDMLLGGYGYQAVGK